MSGRLGLVINQERCIGCEACTVACQKENKGLKGWVRVETQNVSRQDTPEGRFPDLKMNFMPRLCNQCAEPPCVESCPTEALVKRDDGVVVLEEDSCNACQICLAACPYEAILFNPASDVIEKCNFCVHRIDEGLEPFCVICCEGQALTFGDLNDPDSEAARLAAGGQAFQLDTNKSTDPSVFYLPPKEPREL